MLKKKEADSLENLQISNWREIFENLGYPIPTGDKVRTRAVYRDGDANNSVLLDFVNKTFYDFPERVGGPFSKLYHLSTGKNISELDGREYIKPENILKREEPITDRIPKYYSEECLKNLVPDYEYFIRDRKISKETLITFEAGMATKNSMAGRLVFVIRDPENGRIIGYTGRVNKKVDKSYKFPKWLHSGKTGDFIYNYKIAFPAIKETKKVILCESVGDILALYESGIKNSLCLFGLNLSSKLLKYLLILNPDKIIVATNKDGDKNGGRGEAAAQDIYNQLLNHFSREKVQIGLPPESNDWNDELINNGKHFIQDWYKNLDKNHLQKEKNSIECNNNHSQDWLDYYS